MRLQMDPDSTTLKAVQMRRLLRDPSAFLVFIPQGFQPKRIVKEMLSNLSPRSLYIDGKIEDQKGGENMCSQEPVNSHFCCVESIS